MPKQNYIQTSFTAGEITPLLSGRPDLTKYQSGVAFSRNMYVRSQGGLFRRQGTLVVGEIADSSTRGELYPFVFSTEQPYILEFTPLKIRVYRDASLVEDGGSPVEIVTPYSKDDLSDLYFAQSADVLYICHPNHAPRTLSRTSHTDWNLAVLEFSDGPYLSSGFDGNTYTLSNIVHRATLTSTDNEFVAGDVGSFVEYYNNGLISIGEITDVVSGTEILINPKTNVVDPSSIDGSSVLEYVTGPDRIRSTVSIWTNEVENSYIKVDGTWYLTGTHQAGTETVTGTPDYSTDVINVSSIPTVKATTGVLSFSNETNTADLSVSGGVFDADVDVGRKLRLNFTSDQVGVTIDTINSSSSAAVSLSSPMPTDPLNPGESKDNGQTTSIRFGSWYVGNYPRCVTIHEDRLAFASTKLEPQTIWLSSSGDYTNFSPTDTDSQVVDSNAITRTIGAEQVNAIVWLQSGPVLLAGTTGGEWQIKPSSINDSLTPTNISATRQTANGSIDGVQPQTIGSSTLFIQRDGRTLREMVYSFEIDRFVSKDISVISEHLIRKSGRVTRSTLQMVPNQIYWMVTSEGDLIGVTYEKEQEVVAWHKHNLSGKVESIAALPAEDATEDELYVIVNRTINGQVKRYVERVSFEPLDDTALEDMVYLDSAKKFSGTNLTELTGLDHLEGRTVGILVDGYVHPDQVVSGGQVSIRRAASKAVVGLPYESIFRTLSPEAGSAYGSSQGLRKKLVSVYINIFNTVGFSHGEDRDSLVERSFRKTTSTLGQAPDPRTGYIEVKTKDGFNDHGQLWFSQSKPYPFNVLSVMKKVLVNE